MSGLPEDQYNEITRRLTNLEIGQAVRNEKLVNIETSLGSLASTYKVLNEHHIDVERDLGIVKTDMASFKSVVGDIKDFMKITEGRFDKNEKSHTAISSKLDKLETTLGSVKNTIFGTLALVGGIITVVVFVFEYIFK